MSRLAWNQPGERFYEAGVDRTVLYPKIGPGVAWNGVTAINEAVSGGDLEQLYFDGVKYADIVAAEDFQATLEAFNAPAEFRVSDGIKQLVPGLFVTQQPRQSFGLCYRTLIGNDLEGSEYGYKLHLVYNCTASPSSRNNQTLDGGSPSAPTRSWQINTVPPQANTFKPTAHLVLDSTLIDPYLIQEIEIVLYGRDAEGGLGAILPSLPSVDELLSIMGNTISEFIEATI